MQIRFSRLFGALAAGMKQSVPQPSHTQLNYPRKAGQAVYYGQ